MFARRAFLRIARLLLGTFLLVQGAFVTAACDSGARDPARAIAAMVESRDAPPCHNGGAADPMATLCVTHCLGEQQIDERATLPMPALAFQPGLVVTLAMPPQAVCAVCFTRPLAVAGPPARIRFQSFLI
jgi:hypothetical protein